MADRILTPEFRVNFPKVFTPEKNDLSGEMEYSLVALFPKGADIAVLKKLAADAIVEKWGADKTKWPKNLRSPFRDQEEKEKEGVLPAGYEKGAVFINMKSKQKAGIVDGNRQSVIDATAIYSGCYMRAQVFAFGYTQKGNSGVAIWFDNLQKTRDGEPLSGRQKAEDAFEAVAAVAGGNDVDPFAA